MTSSSLFDLLLIRSNGVGYGLTPNLARSDEMFELLQMVCNALGVKSESLPSALFA